MSTDESLIFGQIALDKQCNPSSDCSLDTGLIMVYTVADSAAHFYWGIIAGQRTAVLAAGAGGELLAFCFLYPRSVYYSITPTLLNLPASRLCCIVEL